MELVETADFFQDVPFSCPYSFITLHQKYKNAKFILTVRDSSEQWYNSITKFHSKKWSDTTDLPTKDNLMEAEYLYKGYAWIIFSWFFRSPEDFPYDKTTLIEAYERHNKNVIDYFSNLPEFLLVLNVAEEDAIQKLASFLNVDIAQKSFPWLNKT